MFIDETPYQLLKNLIEEEDKQNETECGEYLKYCQDLLVTGTPTKFIHSETQYRGNKGDSDYIISCETDEGAGIEINRAFIWELKAPQCYLFKEETKQRLIPSDDLIKAENQLLNYYHEYKQSGGFQRRFDVHPDHIYFGGIIIGNKRRFVQGKYEETKRSQLYSESLNLRKTYFYKNLGIKIYTWDRILDQLKTEEPQMDRSAQVGEAISAHSGSVKQDIEFHD